MSAEYHRYTSNGKGVYQALKDEIFARYGKEEGAKIWKAFLEDPDVTWLKRPDGYPEGASSWFTAAGDRKFVNRTLPKMMEHMDGDKIDKETTTSPGKAVYEDEDQVVAEKKAEAIDDIEARARLHYPAEGSHGWNHIQDVLANARRMRRRKLLKKELAAIMYHDSSLMTGSRDMHAEDSSEIARKELAGLFRRRQLEDIVNAIAHHRASYEGRRSSRLEDLVAAADRPVPDLGKQVARSWKYHEELGEPEELRAKNVAAHLKEKYGHGGYAYANAPKLYLKTYGNELRDIMSKFDGLTPEAVASMMSGVPEKKASAKIDIPALYEEVRRAYSEIGYPVSGDHLVISEQPTYVDGRPVPADVMNPNESGGNTQHDGTVRINPRYRAVMRHWGLKGPGRDFLRTIIGHEVGHHIDRTVLGDRPEERRRLLREIAKAKFHTVYTDSYGPDTDPRKLDKELLAEYLAKMVKRKLEKKAEQAPSEEDLRRMYDIVQSDAKLTRRIEGLGFGRDGEAYRKAAIRLRVMELAKVLRDGKMIRNRIVHTPGYIPSKQDADRALRQYTDAHAGLTRFLNGEEKSAEIKLRDGKYSDVKKVYDALTDEEKNFVTPGRRVYKDVPKFLAGRTVAYEGREPMGFSDIYGLNSDGSLRSSPNICLAVSESARGQRLASTMTKDVMRKVLERAQELRREKGRRADKIKRFVWMALKDNAASAKAALKTGFKEQPSSQADSRKFTMSRREAERMTQEDK